MPEHAFFSSVVALDAFFEVGLCRADVCVESFLEG